MEIEELRKEIDTLDSELSRLYLKRLSLSLEVGAFKRENNLDVENSKREEEILFNLLKNVKSEEDKLSLLHLYGFIFDESKALQSSLIPSSSPQIDAFRAAIKNKKSAFPLSASVACQGVEGAYSEAAARKAFSVSSITYFKSFEAVFSAVQNGLCDYGIVPLENSTVGSVLPVYDALTTNKLYIIRSVSLKVGHSLLTKDDATPIKTVYSHPQALEQCKGFIKKLGAVPVATENTALAAKMVKESSSNDVAAIAGEDCAALYSLKVRNREIQDDIKNTTTFICISRNLEIYKGANKVSLLTSIPHKKGSLASLLSRFYIENLNLTKLVTRPLSGEDGYMFYFDFEGDAEKNSTLNLLSSLEKSSSSFAFLGEYSGI